LDALAREIISVTGSPATQFDAVRASLVQVQRGGPNQGSWVHEKVAVDLARWLAPAFAVWMDGWLLEVKGLSSPTLPHEPPAPRPLGLPLRVPPLPEIIRHERSVALPGNDHLYAARRLPDGLMKIGVSKDPLDRMPELQRSFQAAYDLLAVWPGEEALEELVLDKLRPHRVAVGASREHFSADLSLDQVRQVVDAVRELQRTRQALASQNFEQRKRELELQADLEDRGLKRRREEVAIEADRVAIEADRLLQKLVAENHPEATKVFLELCSRPRRDES